MATTATDPRVKRAWAVLDTVEDPEIPQVSVVDLGMIRDVSADGDGLRVALSPTYSGCPATVAIRLSVEAALAGAGFEPVSVTEVLSPAWTTDWITEKGRARLLQAGIAPPAGPAGKGALLGKADVACPHCGSRRTEQVSAFGATACKALYRCTACLEPFDYFRCI